MDDRSSIFYSSSRSDRPWDPPTLLSHGCRGQSGRDVEVTSQLHLLAEVKNARICTCILPYVMTWCLLSTGCVFTAWYLVMQRDDFTLLNLLNTRMSSNDGSSGAVIGSAELYSGGSKITRNDLTHLSDVELTYPHYLCTFISSHILLDK
jgi:hypothetical protein